MKVEELDWISRVGRSRQTGLAGFFAKTGLCTPKTKARGEEGSKEPKSGQGALVTGLGKPCG